MTTKKQLNNSQKTDSLNDDCRALRGGGERESVAMPSNTATNNSNNEGLIKFLRFGVDSLYLSYQGEIFESVDEKLSKLKLLARSDIQDQQAKAQYKIGDHLFEVKDKGTSMFAYILKTMGSGFSYRGLTSQCRWLMSKYQANTSLIKHPPMQKNPSITFSPN